MSYQLTKFYEITMKLKFYVLNHLNQPLVSWNENRYMEDTV